MKTKFYVTLEKFEKRVLYASTSGVIVVFEHII